MKFLQSQGQVLVVSRRVRTTLRRAYLGRRFFAGKLAREKPVNRGNATHAHFVGVLAEVVSALAPLLHVKSASGGTVAVDIDADAIPSNLFVVLAQSDSQEEDSIATDADTTITTDLNPSPDAPTILYEAEADPTEEVRLRLLCLRAYIEERKNFVLSVWSLYFAEKRGRVDLAIATLVTELLL